MCCSFKAQECFKWTLFLRRSPCDVVANVLDCDIVVNDFELHSRDYVQFKTNNL